MECPLPVVKTKDALKEENVVSTIVDNEIAVENLTKFAKVKNYSVSSKQEGKDYIVEISKGDEEADFEVDTPILYNLKFSSLYLTYTLYSFLSITSPTTYSSRL